MTVSFSPGQLLGSSEGSVMGTSAVGTAALILKGKTLLIDEVDGAVSVTKIVLKLAGYVGYPVAEIKELRFPDEGKKPELARVELVMLTDSDGNPNVGREDTLRLADGAGMISVGREVILAFADGVGNPYEKLVRLLLSVGEAEMGRDELIDAVGNPVVPSGALRLPVEVGANPELGRVKMLALALKGGMKPELGPVTPVEIGANPELGRVDKLALALAGGMKPELGPVRVGRRVVALIEIVGARLGTETVVAFRVDAIVGRVPDEARVLGRDRDELTLGYNGETLTGAVPIGAVTELIVTVGAVTDGGRGTTDTVDKVVRVAGLPCRVSVWVVVPVVT
ncbi:MAG: hypothetical protein Q9182_001974 [Xanthomendoza sp. 2 TL-2023]